MGGLDDVSSYPAPEPGAAGPPLEPSPRTLERWRWRDQGPAYLKVGGRVVYRLTDIEAFERDAAHRPDAVRQEARP